MQRHGAWALIDYDELNESEESETHLKEWFPLTGSKKGERGGTV
jgi:hypothetical protein